MIETMLPNLAVATLDRHQVTPVRPADRRCQVSTSMLDMPPIDEPGTVMTTPIVRKLTAIDANDFQALRLEGLVNHPCEFGAAEEEEADLPLSDVEQRLANGCVYGAFIDGKLAAIAGFRRFERMKKRHKAELFGVYVGKDFRGIGLGETVVRQIIAVARNEVEQLLATVASLNHPARSLYAKLGFEAFGHEPRAHKVGDQYFDQDHLVLPLK